MHGRIIMYDTVERLLEQHGSIESAYFFFKDQKELRPKVFESVVSPRSQK
jgi:hypothetical protein